MNNLKAKARMLNFPYINFKENDLIKYFLENEEKIIFKWIHYFEIYEKIFYRFRNKENLKILEIGVNRGGSLQMWKKYFGEQSKIVGIDIDSGCKALEEKGIEIRIGSQADPSFLKSLIDEFEYFDIIIDDGSHINEHQIISFTNLFESVKDDGIYLCEDCHTSYWPSHGGGYLNKNSFIEYSKSLIDSLNAFHSKEKEEFSPNYYTRNIKSMTFYDSIVVFNKGKSRKPFTRKTGKLDWKKSN